MELRSHSGSDSRFQTLEPESDHFEAYLGFFRLHVYIIRGSLACGLTHEDPHWVIEEAKLANYTNSGAMLTRNPIDTDSDLEIV
jgi:hypothetical protein